MLAELIELCLEPKRINELRNLTYLFPDLDPIDERESQSNNFLDNNVQQNQENPQPPQIPLPPIPDIFPVQQQLNINDNIYQLPVFHTIPSCPHHPQESNLSSIHHNCSNAITGSNSSTTGSNNSKSIYNAFKSNSSIYCNFKSSGFKNYCVQSPTSSRTGSFCSSCNNQSSLKNHLTTIISNNLSDDVNWQSNLSSVRERNAVLFNNEYMSDVTFCLVDSNKEESIDESKNKSNEILGNKNNYVIRIPAHKYILASASSVFYAMLYGGLAERSSEIELPDVDAQGFLTLLRYLYCDDICLDNENVLFTFYVAKKYIVPYLAKACIAYLEKILNAQNACILLQQIRMFEEEQTFIKECLNVIDAQTEQAFKSSTFVDIDEETLKLILERETLNTKELVIFEACLNWATSECQRQNLDANSTNKRKVLDKLIYLIRIPTMNLDDFANGPAQTNVLTSEETADLFIYLTAKKQPNSNSIDKFNLKKRKGLDLYVISRFQSSKIHSHQWRYRDNKCDSIQFAVDHKIFLQGYSVFGSYSNCSIYKLKMELKKNGKILASKNTQLCSDGTTRKFRLMFDHPIEIYPNQSYTASVTLDGNSLSFYGQDGLTEVIWNRQDKFVTFDFQCSPESNNGTGRCFL